MLVLALDTTTKAGSGALARDGIVVREQAADAAQPHDRRLPADLEALLEEAGVDLAAIDVFAVATGPGSFTGVRVGIATMQGLAFAAEKPLIGISAFDALAGAAAAGESRRIATWIDAWRGDVYAALYEDGVEVQAPAVVPPAVLLPRLRGRRTRFVGDAAAIYRSAIVDALGTEAEMADPLAPLLAGTIALAAASLAQAGHHPPPHAIRPLYVRRLDAEPARDPRPVG